MRHNPPLFIGIYTHNDLVTNIDDVLPTLPYFEYGHSCKTRPILLGIGRFNSTGAKLNQNAGGLVG